MGSKARLCVVIGLPLAQQETKSGVKQNLKTRGPDRVLSLQMKFQTHIAMKKDYNSIKALVGTTNVIITSELRYSELHALVEIASVLEKGILTIKVIECTLRTDEITALAKLGGAYVAFDLTEC